MAQRSRDEVGKTSLSHSALSARYRFGPDLRTPIRASDCSVIRGRTDVRPDLQCRAFRKILLAFTGASTDVTMPWRAFAVYSPSREHSHAPALAIEASASADFPAMIW